MDRQYRQLQRQARLGDTLAQLQVEHLDCRMGQHTVREDQIVLSSDWQKASDDVAGCRCGDTIIDGKALCKLGHHHLYYNPWVSELAYRCVRLAMDHIEYRNLQNRFFALVNARERGFPFNEESQIEAQLEEMRAHPYVMHGCTHKVVGDAACALGMHFLDITPEGRKCRNPSCSFKEADACRHPGGTTINIDADGREVQRCARCQMAFYDEGICTVFHHKPDARIDDPCMRARCPSHRKGKTLYEALAAAHRAGKPLQAVCRERGVTLAEASGWTEKLRSLGVAKPTATKREENGVKTYIGKPIYAIMVRVYAHREQNHGEFAHWQSQTTRAYASKRHDYATMSAADKERLAGRWYPVLDK